MNMIYIFVICTNVCIYNVFVYGGPWPNILCIFTFVHFYSCIMGVKCILCMSILCMSIMCISIMCVSIMCDSILGKTSAGQHTRCCVEAGGTLRKEHFRHCFGDGILMLRLSMPAGRLPAGKPSSNLVVQTAA